MMNVDIEKAVIRSQHCQRNFDLEKEIPEKDLKTLVHASTQCPSKQNISFYNLHFITNRLVIDEIYKHTEGFVIDGELEKNTQVLANLLVAYTKNSKSEGWYMKKHMTDETIHTQVRDVHMSTGISSGYLNLTASILGYSTGCCLCFDEERVRNILDVDEEVLLLMGIGFKNTNKNRRVHALDETKIFDTFKKEEISVNYIR